MVTTYRIHPTEKKKRRFTPSATSTVKRQEALRVEDFITHIEKRLREGAALTQEKPFQIDVDAAVRTLENTPHPRHKLSDEVLKRVHEILARIDAADIDDSMPTDISENLDEFIYPHTDEDSTK